jgi:hypothetical protein
MKKILMIVIFFGAFVCKAQNYQCLQNGVKNYFINGNGYLRAIKIDSVGTTGPCLPADRFLEHWIVYSPV